MRRACRHHGAPRPGLRMLGERGSSAVEMLLGLPVLVGLIMLLLQSARSHRERARIFAATRQAAWEEARRTGGTQLPGELRFNHLIGSHWSEDGGRLTEFRTSQEREVVPVEGASTIRPPSFGERFGPEEAVRRDFTALGRFLRGDIPVDRAVVERPLRRFFKPLSDASARTTHHVSLRSGEEAGRFLPPRPWVELAEFTVRRIGGFVDGLPEYIRRFF